MALPGGGMPLGFPGGTSAGMSEQQMQEQRMVKMVRFYLYRASQETSQLIHNSRCKAQWNPVLANP